MADVLCPICGRPNSDHREFCDFCGNPLDGALRVEDDHPPLRDNLQDNQAPESLDEESRLESLLSTPEEEIPSSRLDAFQDEEPLDADSRLESLLGPQDEELQRPRTQVPGPTMPLNGESRLDDYLPVEKPTADLDPEPVESEDSSRLGAYLTPEQAADALPLDFESLSEEDENGSSRLDEYLQPDVPQDPIPSDRPIDQDHFLADDPFKSLDPFQDPSAGEDEDEDPFSLDLKPFQEPPVEDHLTTTVDDESLDPLSFSREAFFSDSSAKDTPDKEESDQSPVLDDQPSDIEEPSPWDFLESTPDGDLESETKDPGEWDFLDPSPNSEAPETGKSAPSTEPEEFDFLDPNPPAEEPDAVTSAESPDPAIWEFLDPKTTPDEGQDKPEEEPADADPLDFLDPSPTTAESETVLPPESIDPGEWNYLDPASNQDEPVEVVPAEDVNGGEWDFLDPSPSADLEEDPNSAGEEPAPSTTDDWSFLDPGPTDDLTHKEAPPEDPAPGSGEDAGWLDMLQDPETRQQMEAESTRLQEPEKPQTDWLDKIRRLNQSSDLVDEDSSFPDWLSVSGKTAEFKGKSEEGGEETSNGVPDWLNLDDDESLDEFLRKKDLGKDEYRPKFTTDPLDSDVVLADDEEPAGDLGDSQQIKFPSWAGDERKRAAKDAADQIQEDLIPEDDETSQPFQLEEEFFDDLFSEELPSWLTATSSEEPEKTIGFNLEQGELPGWVEAMRPVVESSDASGLDEDEDYIENYGPLAGIPSVLPAEAEIGIDLDKAVQKPLDLLATKKQKDYVDLLKTLIGDEDKSDQIKVPPRQQTQRILRWLIAVLMVVAVAATVVFSGPLAAEPPSTSQISGTGFSALFDEIETLYDGQPVLIAYDYQPAAAGEMHIAAAAVVDHLMEQGTYLTFISTQPTGPALAEHFLETTQSRHRYQHTQKYINLGYLPGESAGLLSFTIAPQKIIPLAFDGSNAWDSPPLISVDGIQDFKMILVITDDPNTAKIWIEQVGSRLERTPLVMVVSAQVEPLIQPYFRTSPRQVSGYVAGIIDSMNYEQLTQRPYLASESWLPFNIGIVVSVGIIFISGLANGVLSLFKRQKDFLTGESK